MISIKFISTFALIGIILSSGCSNKVDKNLEEKISELQYKIEILTLDLQILETKFDLFKSLQNVYNTATLDPTSPGGYQRIDTSSGFFLVSLVDLKPYLEGYRLILHIGNPSSATYSGFVLKAKWGKKYKWEESTLSYSDWEKSLQQKEASFTEKLKSGTWNEVEFIISPVKSEQFDYIELSMQTKLISLYTQ